MPVYVTSGDRGRARYFLLDEFGVQKTFPERGRGIELCLITRLDVCSDIHLQPPLLDLVTALRNAGGSSRGSLAAMLGKRTVASELTKLMKTNL